MGYFVCQHCGAHLHDSKVEDLYQLDGHLSAQNVKKKTIKRLKFKYEQRKS